MSVPVFHAPREQLAGSSTVRLDGPEGRHAALVRRLQPRERIDLTDGAGLLASCVILHSDGYALDLEVQDLRMVPAPSPRLTVVQGLAKGERGETAVETMTEIGVDVIVPWSAGRSIAQWKGERGVKSLAKWRSTAREAAKQARRSWWPEVTEPATTAKVARLLAAATVPVVLHEEAELALAELQPPQSAAQTSAQSWAGPGSSSAADPDTPAALSVATSAAASVAAMVEIVLVVGPEGGISPEELVQFAEAGAAPYRMGPTVLRTSTAGTAAAAVLLARSGRWA